MCFHQFNLLCACFVFGCVVFKCAYCSAQENSKSEHLLQHHPFLESIFEKYGSEGRISQQGLQRLLENLSVGRSSSDCGQSQANDRLSADTHLHLPDLNVDEGTEHSDSFLESSVHSQAEKHTLWNATSLLEYFPLNLSLFHGGKCISTEEVTPSSHRDDLTPVQFLSVCPAIVYQLDRWHCTAQHTRLETEEDLVESLAPTLSVWLFSTLAVVIISLCGLLSVAVVPLIHHSLYHSMLQFLIGLAVGSLSGDALLHLLPHAMTGLGHNDHQGATNTGEDHDDHHQQETYIWTGLVALAGIFIFYSAERILNLAMACCGGKKTIKSTSQVSRLTFAVHSADQEQCRSVGEKLSHHKHDMEDVLDDRHVHEKLVDEADIPGVAEAKAERLKGGDFERANADNVDVCHTERVIFQNGDERQSCVVAVTDHHHHSHRHPHSNSVSAVAWMVIMGDGLHNLCDGLAIGAAFVSGLSSGLSTTVAVFCHELPHELGDFAMLLKAGMPVKQALLYNGLSSFLCFVGMLIGVLLGNVGSATLWVFAGAAGMFLYIALVDMLPELDNVASRSVSTSIKHFFLQIFGIVLGVSIMLVIALYEHDLKHLIR